MLCVWRCLSRWCGSEVQILPGDADAEAGGVDEENANRKTVSELLSLNPHDSNVFPAPLQLEMYMRYRPRHLNYSAYFAMY